MSSRERQAGIIYCASSINPPPSPISRTARPAIARRGSPGVAECGHTSVSRGWKVMLRCVPAAVGITCRINTIPARGISERRRHELRITACTRPRYARTKAIPQRGIRTCEGQNPYNTVPLKLNIPTKRIRETAIWNRSCCHHVCPMTKVMKFLTMLCKIIEFQDVFISNK